MHHFRQIIRSGSDENTSHHSDEGVAAQARDDGVADGVEGAAGRAVGGQNGQNGRPTVDCASGRSDEGVSPGGDNDDDGSVLKRGERVRLIPPSLSLSSSSSNLHLAAFLVFLDGGGVGVGVESVAFGVGCVGVGGAGGAGEAGCSG